MWMFMSTKRLYSRVSVLHKQRNLAFSETVYPSTKGTMHPFGDSSFCRNSTC